MNRRTLIVVISILVVIVAAAAYVLTLPNKADAPALPPQPQTQAPAQQSPAVKGSYIDYSADLVASTKGTKLLFFYAPWCPQCRSLDASIKAATLPDNVTIFKVDYDSNQALRSTYGVTIQTTVVKVNDQGAKVDSYTAYEEPTFDAVSRALLP